MIFLDNAVYSTALYKKGQTFYNTYQTKLYIGRILIDLSFEESKPNLTTITGLLYYSNNAVMTNYKSDRCPVNSVALEAHR